VGGGDSGTLREGGARPDPMCFNLAGCAFVAVPQDGVHPRPGGVSFGGARLRPAVGRIVCSGTPYTLYEAESDERVTGAAPLRPVSEILTRRELQVALLISDGRCDKEIARHLGISGYTVREHIRRMFAKLKISRRSAVGACVLRRDDPMPL
jgi:DNA-binding CsgD family transcriptional regulator